MNTETETMQDLKGKSFDEVCDLIRDEKGIQGSAHKKSSASARWGFCLEFTPHDYTEMQLLAVLAAEFGPGEYPVQFKAPAKKGPPRIRWQQNFQVEARRISAAQRENAKLQPAGDVMAIAIENQTALLAAILEKVSQPPPAPPKEKSTLDIVGELSAFKDLFSSKQPSPLALMKDAMELKELIMGDSAGADDDPLTMAFKHLVPEIMDGVKAMREAEEERSKRSIRTAPAREPRRRPDVDAELSPQDRAHAEDAVDMERDAETQTRLAFDFFAQKFLTPVLVLAGKDEDPQTVGYYLARLIGRDPAALDIVGQVLSEDNFIERLAQYNAEILQHADWIDLTTAWLAHALWPDANDAPEPESATNSATIDEKEDFQGIKAGPADSGPGGDQGLDQGNGEPSNDADSSASGPGPANDP